MGKVTAFGLHASVPEAFRDFRLGRVDVDEALNLDEDTPGQCAQFKHELERKSKAKRHCARRASNHGCTRLTEPLMLKVRWTNHDKNTAIVMGSAAMATNSLYVVCMRAGACCVVCGVCRLGSVCASNGEAS